MSKIQTRTAKTAKVLTISCGVFCVLFISLFMLAFEHSRRPMFGLGNRFASTESLIDQLWVHESLVENMNTAACFTPASKELSRRKEDALPDLIEAIQTKPDVLHYRLALVMCEIDPNCIEAIPALLELLLREEFQGFPFRVEAYLRLSDMDTEVVAPFLGGYTLNQVYDKELDDDEHDMLLTKVQTELPPKDDRLAAAKELLKHKDRRIVHSAAVVCWFLGHNVYVGFDYKRVGFYNT